jgi:hypothetical protein
MKRTLLFLSDRYLDVVTFLGVPETSSEAIDPSPQRARRVAAPAEQYRLGRAEKAMLKVLVIFLVIVGLWIWVASTFPPEPQIGGF